MTAITTPVSERFRRRKGRETALVRAFRPIGGFVGMFLDTLRAMVRRPFQVTEFLEQVVFVASVSILPAIMVAIPFTVIAIFLINQFLIEVGAMDYSGAGAGLAVMAEIGPIAAVLVVAGAGATAMCADLGARKIREELDAMKVMGVDPIQRLVVPRVLAGTVVAVGLSGIVSTIGLTGGYTFSVVVQGASAGSFAANLTTVVGFTEFIVGQIKALVFGFTASIVACYLGMNAKGGPKGVGEAVNQTVVYAFMVLFFFNSLITSIAFQFT